MKNAIPFYLTEKEYLCILKVFAAFRESADAETASVMDEMIADLIVQCNDNTHLAVEK